MWQRALRRLCLTAYCGVHFTSPTVPPRKNVVIFKLGTAFGIENAGQISIAGMNNLLSSRDMLEYWANKPSVVCIQHYHSIATNMRCRGCDYVMKINVWSTYGSNDVIEARLRSFLVNCLTSPCSHPPQHDMTSTPDLPIDFSNPAVRDYMSLIRYYFH